MFEMLDKEKKYVIGVSGGCDSMYLLDTLRKEGYSLYVVHVNYHLRHDSDEDYLLVHDYCQKYQLPFFYKECKEDDYHGGNFQDEARMIRYQFYLEIYQQFQCDGLVLGHHLDDYLESVYMQLEKHHVTYFLGIRTYNQVMTMNVFRPLMTMYKDEIREACHKYDIPYRDDYTNFETDFERDRVRNTVLNQYTQKQKEELLLKAYKHNERIKELEFKVSPYYQHYQMHKYISLQSIPDDLQEIFLYLILKDVIDPSLISQSLIYEMIHQMQSSKPNIRMNLPVNYLFIKEYDNICVTKNQNVSYCYRFEKYEPFVCEYFSLKECGHQNEGVYLREDDYPITIRTIKSGDRIQTSSGTKKVSRLFINAKIPSLQRKIWPIVVNRDGIIVLVPNIAKNMNYLTTKPNLFVIK